MTQSPQFSDYKKFFDETPVALIRTSIETGEFLMANKYAASMFGFKSVEELQENYKSVNFYPPDERKKLITLLKKIGVIENYEIKLTITNKTIWVSARLQINCGGSCIEGSLIDITEKVELRNKELERLKNVSEKLDKKIAALDNSVLL